MSWKEKRKTLKKLDRLMGKAVRGETLLAVVVLCVAILVGMFLMLFLAETLNGDGIILVLLLMTVISAGALQIYTVLRCFTTILFGRMGYLVMGLPVSSRMLSFWQIRQGSLFIWMLQVLLLRLFCEANTQQVFLDLLESAGIDAPRSLFSFIPAGAQMAFADPAGQPLLRYLLVLWGTAAFWALGFSAMLFLACCIGKLYRLAGSGLLCGIGAFLGLLAADNLVRYAALNLSGLSGGLYLTVSCAVSLLAFGLCLAGSVWLLEHRYNLD